MAPVRPLTSNEEKHGNEEPETDDVCENGSDSDSLPQRQQFTLSSDEKRGRWMTRSDEESFSGNSNSCNSSSSMAIEVAINGEAGEKPIGASSNNSTYAKSQDRFKGDDVDDVFSELVVGMEVDCLDSVQRWSEAEVLKIDRQLRKVYITYTYWSNNFDEWISEEDLNCRIAPLHRHTYVPNGPIKLGQRIEVRDDMNKWMEAFVINEAPDSVHIHYRGFHQKFDVWLPRQTDRIRPFGRHKAGIEEKKRARLWQVPGQASSDSSSSSSLPMAAKSGSYSSGAYYNLDRTRQINDNTDSFAQYIDALGQRSYRVFRVEGDGNCLFRSVAHQVYGDDSLHGLVREKCMDYMESESAFYSQFVEGGIEHFSRYLSAKRLNGCWGDDPEIQAICELYDRPAEIWAYDPTAGARRLRTFHEPVGAVGASQRRNPMRLSFYGGGHYDSIVDKNHEDRLLKSPPGQYEQISIARLSQRGSMEAEARLLSSSDAEATERATLDLALQASRREINSWGDDDLQTCLALSLSDAHARGLHISSNIGGEGKDWTDDEKKAAPLAPIANGEDELATIQREMFQSISAQSEREFLEKAIEDSLVHSQMSALETSLTEDELFEQARLASLAASSSINGIDRRVENNSLDQGQGQDQGYGMLAGSDIATGASAIEDDPEIALALELSTMSEEEAFQYAIRQSITQSSNSSSTDSTTAFSSPNFVQTSYNTDHSNSSSNRNSSYGGYQSLDFSAMISGSSSNDNNSNNNNNSNNDFDDDDDVRRAIEESLRQLGVCRDGHPQ